MDNSLSEVKKTINIVGGGPGGLFLAILLRQHRPDWTLNVWERNPPHATFGFGVVFSDRTVELLDKADPVSLARIREEFQSWTDIEVATWNGVRRTRGHGFSAIARHRLLAILQERARELGIAVSYEDEALDFDHLAAESDLLVGSDGINSLVRQHWSADFEPDIRMGRARFIWFATPRRYDALTFHFVQTPFGPFSTHAYPFSEELSTFIVEVDEETWRRAGLDPADHPPLEVGQTDEFAKAFCEEIFADSLQGEPLVGNASQWRQFPTVRNASWIAHDKIVILGDAAHTAHFSVGSGTKMAMEDAAALAEVLIDCDDIGDALQRYQQTRKESVTKIQQLAEPSRGWWENFHDWVDRDLDAMAVNFLTRTGRETVEHLARRDADFASEVVDSAALTQPLALASDLELSGRRGLRLPQDPRERDHVIQAVRDMKVLPSFIVLDEPAEDQVSTVRTAFGTVCPPIAAVVTVGSDDSMNLPVDLFITRDGVTSSSIPVACLLETPSTIDDTEGWLQLIEQAEQAQADGACAICLESSPSQFDRRSLMVHAGVMLRPRIDIPIIVWDAGSDQEVLTHINADRADAGVGYVSAGFFSDVHETMGLNSLLAPDTVMVVGASQSSGKAGHALMSNLAGFTGGVVGLGRSQGSIGDRPIITDLADLDRHVDLAVLAVPAQAVPGALENLGKHGVRAAIVCSGGFAETGSAEGIALQEEITKIRKRHGMRILGPNTSGMSLPPRQLHASFVPAVTEFAPGAVAVLAQSGGVAHATALALTAEGIGIGTMIGTGNACDVDLPELITAIAERGDHSVIAVHLEGTSSGNRLQAAVREASRKVPVVVLKSGVSDVDRLASSHTGALTGDWSVAQAMLREAGAVVVSTMGHLVDSVASLSLQRLTSMDRTPATGVVTGQAGPGILLTDHLQTLGVTVPELSPSGAEKVESLLPALTHRQNPVDTGRPGDNFADIIEAVGSDPNIDAIAVYALLEPGALDLVKSLSDAASETSVPIVAATNGLVDDVVNTRGRLRDAGIPLYVNPERAATGVWALFEDRHAASLRDARPSAPATTPRSRSDLSASIPSTEADTKHVLVTAGVRVPRSHRCTTRQEAESALTDLLTDSPAVVVKISSEEISHKAEVGGVHLGVASTEDLHAALDAIDVIPRKDAGYLLEQQISPGADLFVAVRRDPSWGLIGLVGRGGTAVESEGDVELFSLPVDPATLSRILTPIGPDASAVTYEVIELIDALTDVLTSWGDNATSIEINPARITAQGLVALDALVGRD